MSKSLTEQIEIKTTNKKLTKNERLFMQYVVNELHSQAQFYQKQLDNDDYEKTDSAYILKLNLLYQRNIYVSMARYLECVIDKFNGIEDTITQQQDFGSVEKGPTESGQSNDTKSAVNVSTPF